ncbi:hypothetical protein BD560DRAFT_412367 [Blakeslea trispora]|nr:hypothetical protein BD560DRAFT_412367 [Blakeslea trispora]
MRSLAGFPTQGTFFLSRNTVEPCQALQEKLFPLASVWLEKIHSGRAEQTVAAEGFLRLLLTLRITFLQDSVYMQKAIPDHPIWRHSLFVDPLYLEFKRLLEASAQTEASQEELLLQRVVPLIERQLANSLEVSQQQHEENRQLQMTVLNQIKDIATGRAPLQINIDWPTGSNIPSTTVRSLASPSVPVSSVPVSSAPASSLSVSSVPASSVPASSVPASSVPASSITLTSSVQTGVTYRMSNVCTITDLYREWTVGLGGNHSIECMNQNHPGWYKSQKSFYMRRNKIMKAIQAQALRRFFSLCFFVILLFLYASFYTLLSLCINLYASFFTILFKT